MVSSEISGIMDKSRPALYKTQIEYESGYCDFGAIRSMCCTYCQVEVHFQLMSVLWTEEVLGYMPYSINRYQSIKYNNTLHSWYIKFSKVCLVVPRKSAIYSITVVYKTWNYGSHTFLLCSEQWLDIWFSREPGDEWSIVNMWQYEIMKKLNSNLDSQLAFKFFLLSCHLRKIFICYENVCHKEMFLFHFL